MEKNKTILTIAIAVFNEEKNLSACLSSVSDIADEIVLVDGGSSDNTVVIAKRFKATIIQTDNPFVFHINKQKALDASTGNWILQLDADEVIPEDLKKEIMQVIQNSASDDGYFIPRKIYFWGHFMKKGGQYPDEVIRLIKKGKGFFPCKSVHEQIEVKGKIGHLTHPMLHYSYKTRADYWKKADTYTSLTATELTQKKDKGFGLFVQYCIIKPVMTFLTLYIRHKGFMDGIAGLEFSLYSGLHFPIAYGKFLKKV